METKKNVANKKTNIKITSHYNVSPSTSRSQLVATLRKTILEEHTEGSRREDCARLNIQSIYVARLKRKNLEADVFARGSGEKGNI